MPGLLAKLADLKAAIDADGTASDAVLTRLLQAATARAEELAGRPLVRQAARVEYPEADMDSRFCWLDLFPIESITSVKQLLAVGADADFTAADALVENVDFAVHATRGRIERINSIWYLRRRWLQVIYSGGYADPADDPQPSGSALPPATLQQGVIQQAVRWWNTRSTAGFRELIAGDIARASFGETKPHPDLVAACDSLRRLGAGL